MTTHTPETIAKTGTDALTANGHAAEKIAKGNLDALTQSAGAAGSALQELTKAYHDLATKNAAKMTSAMQALSAVKNPAEFVELQRTLIKDGVEDAARDGQHIAELTAAVFTAAFVPMKKQIEAVQKSARP